MRQERSSQNLVLVLLAVAVLAMSVGFAAYSQNLTINGTATFKKASWDVHFDDNTFDDSGSTANLTSTHNVTSTTATYTVTLEKPNDVYTFDLDVVNAGTIDAKLIGVSITNDQASAPFVAHTVTIGGSSYSTTTSGLNVALAASASQTVTVRVQYVLPNAANDLPASDVTAHFTVTLQYESAIS